MWRIIQRGEGIVISTKVVRWKGTPGHPQFAAMQSRERIFFTDNFCLVLSLWNIQIQYFSFPWNGLHGVTQHHSVAV